MSQVARYDPFAELARFDPFHDFEQAYRLSRALVRGVPEAPEIKMDVSEDEKSFRIKAEMPGVRKEDIKVSIDGNQVTIGAEVKKDKEEKKGETVIRSERYYGAQYRAFSLRQEVDSGTAEAKYSDGVLELVLPKKQPTSARQVTIK